MAQLTWNVSVLAIVMALTHCHQPNRTLLAVVSTRIA